MTEKDAARRHRVRSLGIESQAVSGRQGARAPFAPQAMSDIVA